MPSDILSAFQPLMEFINDHALAIIFGTLAGAIIALAIVQRRLQGTIVKSYNLGKLWTTNYCSERLEFTEERIQALSEKTDGCITLSEFHDHAIKLENGYATLKDRFAAHEKLFVTQSAHEGLLGMLKQNSRAFATLDAKHERLLGVVNRMAKPKATPRKKVRR